MQLAISTMSTPQEMIRIQVIFLLHRRKLEKSIVCWDLNGDGIDDIIGTNNDGEVYYTLDNSANWQNIPGSLDKIFASDMNGDGKKDIIGLNSSNQVYYTTNLSDWTNIQGGFTSLATGDFNGDGKDDVVGLGVDGNVYYTLDLNNWIKI